MRTAHATLVMIILLFASLLQAPSAWAQGETPGDMRRENDELRNRVAQLEAQVKKLEQEATSLRSQYAQAQAQLARAQRDTPALQAENEALRAQLRALGVEPETPATTTTPGRTAPGAPAPERDGVGGLSNLDPMACPPCLLQALRGSYEERFGSRSIDEDRAEYVKDVRRWAGEMKRDHREPVSWTVEIDPQSIPGDDSMPVKLRVVNPDTREPLVDQVSAVDLGRRNTRRIMSEPDQRFWTIDGVFYADPQVNADRLDEGLIPYPPFIGPFAEFDFGLSVRSVAPAD